ncbi:amidase domain-containing protein [Streptacidiphilus albus]|uniref:amidase domain-containing protein n=1 Tax=Streptacidiphilus albus TaxID=105425 RepID=UPI00054BBD6B|nr:amidase domain-containing protein [Streptacidiphilus albus]
MMQQTRRRRLAVAAVLGGVLVGSAPMLSAPAFAAQPSTAAASSAPASAHSAVNRDSIADTVMRDIEVDYANAHWNWTAWNDSTPVAFGSGQDNYQCAEFVARSLAAAGLIPGLGPNDPQSDYFTYHAPNGEVYDLLLISPLPQYHNLSDYLADSGIGKDIGDQPQLAKPGDIVVTYAGLNGEASHTGLIVTPQTATSEPLVDAHNNARLDYGYHYYAPSHVVQLVPNALVEVWTWAAEEELIHGPQTQPTAPTTTVPQNRLFATPGYSDPAGPQV